MKFSFLSPTFIEREINGSMVKFHPVRVITVGKLRGFLKPLFRGISAINAAGSTDIAKESVETADKEGFRQIRTELKAVTPEIAKLRSEQREKAIDDLIDALLQDQSMRCMAMLILDSLRMPSTEKDAKELIDETDLETMFELVKGVAAANKEVFGPLTERVETMVSALNRAAMKRVPDDAEESAEEQPSDSQPEQPEATTKTDSGSTSSEP